MSIRLAIWALIILVAATYGRICSNQFVWWDDDVTIHHNVSFDPPRLHDLAKYWEKPEFSMYVPVTYTAWWVLALFAWRPDPDAFGISLSPFPFHLASVAAHLLTVLIVFAVLRKLAPFLANWGGDRSALAPAEAATPVGGKEILNDSARIGASHFVGSAPRTITSARRDTVRGADPTLIAQGNSGRRDWAAFAGAALYAVHPVQVESVAWATSLKEGLCGLFAMAALWFYLEAATAPPAKSDSTPLITDNVRAGAEGPGSFDIRSGASGNIGTAVRIEEAISIRRPGILYCAAALMMVLAQLSNPIAAVVPAMAFVLDAMVLRRPWRKAAGWAGGLLLIALPDIIVSRIAQPGVVAPPIPLWGRPLIVTDTLAFYLAKLAIPLHLSTDYARRPDLVLARGWAYWTWILPAIIVAVLFPLGRKKRWILAGALLLAIGFAPVLGEFPFNLQQYSTPADRYFYLAMFGPALIVAGFFSVYRRGWQKCLWLIAILFLATRAFIQCGVWRNDLTLWTQTQRNAPDSAVAYCNLGAWYDRHAKPHQPREQEYVELAIHEYKEAIRRDPAFYKARDNLISALRRLHRDDETILQIEQMLDLMERTPALSQADRSYPSLQLGQLLIERHRPSEALIYLQKAEADNANLPGLAKAIADARKQLASSK